MRVLKDRGDSRPPPVVQKERETDKLIPKMVEVLQALELTQESTHELIRGTVYIQKSMRDLLDQSMKQPKRSYSCSIGRGTDGKIKSIEIVEQ